jgi:hypothetical protein
VVNFKRWFAGEELAETVCSQKHWHKAKEEGGARDNQQRVYGGEIPFAATVGGEAAR